MDRDRPDHAQSLRALGGIGAVCDIVGFGLNGEVQVDFTNIGFRSTWDVMLAGAFTRRDRDQIALYDRAGGALAVVGFDNAGRANLTAPTIRSARTGRRSWPASSSAIAASRC